MVWYKPLLHNTLLCTPSQAYHLTFRWLIAALSLFSNILAVQKAQCITGCNRAVAFKADLVAAASADLHCKPLLHATLWCPAFQLNCHQGMGGSGRNTDVCCRAVSLQVGPVASAFAAELQCKSLLHSSVSLPK